MPHPARSILAAALVAALSTPLPTIASSNMTPKAPAGIEQMTPDAAKATLGAPEKAATFILDDSISEFRIPLLNKFTKAEIASRAIDLEELTFALDEKTLLTVWYRGADYVDHFVYDRLTDF